MRRHTGGWGCGGTGGGEAAALQYWGGSGAGVLGGGAWEATALEDWGEVPQGERGRRRGSPSPAAARVEGPAAGLRRRPAAGFRCGRMGGDGRPCERIGLEELDRLWRWGERKNKFE
jgi:hypothetical protein